MKLIYLKNDGQAVTENATIGARLVEMPDGYHPMTNDGVWQDAKRRRPPVLLIVQGVLGPYGASMTTEDTLHVLYEIEVAERAFRPQNVSKMWARKLAAMFAWMVKYGVMLFMLALAAWAIWSSFMGAESVV